MFQQSYNHGAGCTFAAATTAYLANGKSPKEAVISAKAFVASAIKNGWKMNDFVGPVDARRIQPRRTHRRRRQRSLKYCIFEKC